MKNKINIISVVLLAVLSIGSISCTDYLDKAPESNLTEREVFGNFISFQGWVEEMYICMANYHQRCGGNWFHTFNVTDMLTSVPMYWDSGNYWDQKFLYENGSLQLNGTGGVMSKYVWPLAWYAIRKANLGLQNLELMEGTQEEKNLIKGQCLYFRAFYHLELIQFWGGLPYIDEPLSVSEAITNPRLTYQETAKRIAEDFRAAAELLPVSWRETQTSVRDNDAIRITKIHAYAYLGKNLLYAASPMMNEYSTGRNEYDEELCKEAAVAFGEAIKICESSGRYKLEPWETRSNVFSIWSPGNNARSGGTEVIQNQMVYEDGFARWTTTRAASPLQFNAGNNVVEVPSHNYVKYYHMANGLPIDDPESGFDPKDPWSNREPRFYQDIVYEGVKMVENVADPTAKNNEFAQLSNNGMHRNGTVASGGYAGSVSGYFYKKFTPLGCNPWDNRWSAHQAYQPRLRLGDVYLMYAESVFYGYGSASSAAPGYNYSAQSAIEKIRDRAKLPPLPDKYYSAANFQQTLIRERAVELAFEGHRWFDLRRWNVAGNQEYTVKTAIDFDLDANGKPVNFQERVVATRVFDKKHNWIPFRPEFTKLYEGFPQNPGW